MVEHKFGGDWTEAKLKRLKQYLNQYRQIFSRNPRARYFTTWYVDAFAGSGSRAEESPTLDLLEPEATQEAIRYFAGSAKIALELESPFHRYLFIEKSRLRCDELKSMIAREHPNLSAQCEFRQQDANEALLAWCKQRDWNKDRAVVFLDPYGLQVDWKTIEALGATHGVDLWYLFPLNMRRLLTRDGLIDEIWRERLDTLLGTRDWKSRFYRPRTESNLFGEETVFKRDATIENIKEFIEGRLRTCFHKVADGLVLRNSRSSPLYLLCFAAANEKGAPTALRIAQYILGD
jgi:three-Cys-motif partner protein